MGPLSEWPLYLWTGRAFISSSLIENACGKSSESNALSVSKSIRQKWNCHHECCIHGNEQTTIFSSLFFSKTPSSHETSSFVFFLLCIMYHRASFSVKYKSRGWPLFFLSDDPYFFSEKKNVHIDNWKVKYLDHQNLGQTGRDEA
jgi:hypothetical protein